MTYYHGSSVSDLTTLVPYKAESSTLYRETVYFTDTPEMAALYIQNKPFKWMTYEISASGFITYTEYFPGQLEYFYSGVSGVIYSVDSQSILPTHIQKVYASDKPVKVEIYINVADVCDAILEYDRTGLLQLRRFETLASSEKEEQKIKTISAIQKEKLLTQNSVKSVFVKEKFPEEWGAVEIMRKNER